MSVPPWPLPGGGRVPAIVAELQRQAPGACVWFGGRTWHWWAMVPWLDHLLEATDPETLRRMLTEAMWHGPRRPTPHRPAPSARRDHDEASADTPPRSRSNPIIWTEDTRRRRAAPPRTGIAPWVRLGLAAVAAVAAR